MLKKLFFTAALSAFALWGAAQTTISGEKLWNFSNDPWVEGAFYEGTTTDDITFDGTVGTNKYWKVTSGRKTVDGITYDLRLQSAGNNRTMSINVSSAGTIKWLAVAGGDNNVRTIQISLNNEPVGTAQATTTTPQWFSQSINSPGQYLSQQVTQSTSTPCNGSPTQKGPM